MGKRKPDGTPESFLISIRFTEIGWSSSTDIDQGLKISYESFLEDLKNNKLRK